MWRHADHPAIRVVPSEVLRPFSGNFLITHFGCAASKASLLVFRHYIVNECHDITYDVMALHVTFYYKRSANASVGGSQPLVHPFIRFAFITRDPRVAGA